MSLESLKEKYPLTYSKPMSCGYWCPEEWEPIIENLSEKIEKHLEQNPELQNGFSVDQVKEKFGGFRYYITGGDETIEEYITHAELEIVSLRNNNCMK